MAITVTTPEVGSGSFAGFIVNGVSADVSGCEQLKAAPGAGKCILLRSLTVNSGAAITITIGEGETTPGSVDTALLGPITFAAGQTIQWDFYPMLKLTANKSLVVDGSGAGAVCVFAQGAVE